MPETWKHKPSGRYILNTKLSPIGPNTKQYILGREIGAPNRVYGRDQKSCMTLSSLKLWNHGAMVYQVRTGS